VATRNGAFEAAIRYIASSGAAWPATLGEIAEAARARLDVD
jgi:hypothetical protein